MKLSTIYYEFIDRRISEDGIKESTVKHYNYFVLERFIKRYLNDKDVSDVTLQDYRTYISYLRSEGLETKSVKTYFTHVKAFANYMYMQHYSEVDIIRAGIKIKVYEKITEVFYDDDIEAIFYSVTSYYYPYEKIVIKLVFAILLDTGVRPSELCNIRIQDINHQNRTILIHGDKVYADRIVPVSAPVMRYINMYLMRRVKPRESKYDDYLIISRRTLKPINAHCIQGYVNRYIKDRCHIPRAKAYLFRHSFATRALYLGMPIYDIKLILGHTRVSTTEKYLRNASQLSMAQNVNITDTSALLAKVLFV